MTANGPNRAEQLAEWLRIAFSEDELRVLLTFFPPEEPLIDHLPSQVSHVMRCSEAVRLLERHGAVDDAFFARLRVERPRRGPEISRLARLYLDTQSDPDPTISGDTPLSTDGLRVTELSSLPEPERVEQTAVELLDLEPALVGYRARLADELRLVELPSLPEPDRVEQTAIELLDLFVPQNVDHDAPRHDHSSRRKNDDTQATPPRPQTLDELLISPESPWLLLLGAQGVGKSMATQWLTLKLCIDGHYPAMLPPGLIPVRVELRHFARRRRKAGEDGYDFFDHLAAGARERRYGLNRGDFERLAESGRLVWLFDGLDEIVDPDERSAILANIVALRADGGRGVLTCRLVGSEPIRERTARHDIHCVTLFDFDDDQVDRFLARWHALAFPRDQARGAERRERLSAAIRTNVTLHDLSRNPFLLSLIVVHMDAPPRGRRELLERATEQLLVAWDANRGLTGSPRFTHVLKRQYLQMLAWHMMASPDGAGNVIAEEDLHKFTRDFCEHQFPSEESIADSTARALLDHLRGRTCILGYSGDGAYGFLHRTFLAFLAASEIYNQSRQEQQTDLLEPLFALHWHEWQWRQTLALTCAFLRDRPGVVVRLLQAAICSVGPRFPFTALDMLAELCILSLAEAGASERGLARDCALAVNDWLYHSPDWHGIQGVLTQLFVSVAGRWPGLPELVARPVPPKRSGAFLLPFLAGLPDDGFLVAVLGMIEARELQPYVVQRAHELNRWRGAFTSEVQRRALTTADPALALTFALALAHEAFLPWPPELCEIVLAGAPQEFRDGLVELFTICGERPFARATAARHLRMALTLALCDAWPELVFSHEFSIDLFRTGELTRAGLARVRRAFTAVAASQRDSAGLFHEIVRTQDIFFLNALLEYCQSRPRLLDGLLAAFLHHPWDSGLACVIEWAQSLPERRSFARDAAALRALNFPQDEALKMRIERSLDVYASDSPPAIPCASWFWTIHTLAFHEDDPAREALCASLLELGRARYPEDELEFRFGVTVGLYPGDDARLLRLIEEATTRRPLLAACYRRSLAHPESAPAVPDSDALLADIRGEADERRLLEFAGLTRWVAFWEKSALPWQEVYRHLVAHSKSEAIRVEAAVELADRELIEQLRRDSPESQELIEALLFLDARERLLGVGRP